MLTPLHTCQPFSTFKKQALPVNHKPPKPATAQHLREHPIEHSLIKLGQTYTLPVPFTGHIRCTIATSICSWVRFSRNFPAIRCFSYQTPYNTEFALLQQLTFNREPKQICNRIVHPVYRCTKLRELTFPPDSVYASCSW